MVQIRELQQFVEFEQCVELQRIIWGFDDRDLIPARMMTTVQQHAGFVAGAFEGERVVGFLFAVPSIHDNRCAQHSQMLGILEEYRDRGFGRMLKLAQYVDAQTRGISLITWTFDPLEARNAFLNLNRLGAISQTYYVNLYGERTSSDLHSGLGTDRFLAEWRIGGTRVERILSGTDPTPPKHAELPRVLSWNKGSRFLPAEAQLNRMELQLLAEVPPDTQRLKQLDRQGAVRWREVTRVLFQHYFDRGYWIKALVRSDEVLPLPNYDFRRTFFLLEPFADN